MTDLPIPQPPRRWLRRSLLAMVVLATLLIATHIVLGIAAGRELAAARAAVVAAGLPTRLEDVVPPPVAPERNAAIPLMRAIGLVATELRSTEPGPLSDDLSLPWAKLAGDAVKLATVRDFCSRPTIATAWESLTDAAKRDACRFDLDYGKGVGMTLPHLEHFREFFRVLAKSVELDVLAADRDPLRAATAIRRLGDGLRTIDRYRRGEPLLISYMIAVSIDTFLLDVVRNASVADRLAGFEALAPDLAAADDRNMLLRLVDAERVICVEPVFRQFDKGSSYPIDAFGTLSGMTMRGLYFSSLGTPWRRHDEAYCIRVFLAMRAAIVSGVPVDDKAFMAPSSCPISRLLLPSISPFIVLPEIVTRRHALARCAIALDAFHRRSGAWPADLTALVPTDLSAVPEHIAYRREGPSWSMDGTAGLLTWKATLQSLRWPGPGTTPEPSAK